MKKKLFATVLILAAAIFAVSAYAAPVAAGKPDFSGTWKLNVDKSDFGQMPPPITETNVITQSGVDMKVVVTSEREQGERDYTLSLKLDGKDTPTPAGTFPPESPFQIVSSKAEWTGSDLVVSQQTTFQGNPGTLKSTWTLSPDGKVLTKSTQVSIGMGDFTTKTIYDKQ